MVRAPGGGARATTSLAVAPASAKRSLRRITAPSTVLVGRSVGAAAAPPQPRHARASSTSGRNGRVIALFPKPARLLDLVGELRDNVDVRGLQQALVERAEADRPARAGDGRARRRRLLEEAAAERGEAALIGEIGEIE